MRAGRIWGQDDAPQSFLTARRRNLRSVDFFRRASERGGGPSTFSGAPQIFLTGHRVFGWATEKAGGSSSFLTRHRKRGRPAGKNLSGAGKSRRLTENGDAAQILPMVYGKNPAPQSLPTRRRRNLWAVGFFQRAAEFSGAPPEESGRRQIFPTGDRFLRRATEFGDGPSTFSDAPQSLATARGENLGAVGKLCGASENSVRRTRKGGVRPAHPRRRQRNDKAGRLLGGRRRRRGRGTGIRRSRQALTATERLDSELRQPVGIGAEVLLQPLAQDGRQAARRSAPAESDATAPACRRSRRPAASAGRPPHGATRRTAHGSAGGGGVRIV